MSRANEIRYRWPGTGFLSIGFWSLSVHTAVTAHDATSTRDTTSCSACASMRHAILRTAAYFSRVAPRVAARYAINKILTDRDFERNDAFASLVLTTLARLLGRIKLIAFFHGLECLVKLRPETSSL
jgi:hypothetical protein